MPDPFDKFSDPFAPPKEPCMVCCIHCGSTYDSWRILWRDMPGEAIEGAWCCPIPGCDGIGFGFDILPVDSKDDQSPDVPGFEFDDEADDEEMWSPDDDDDEEDSFLDDDEFEPMPIDEFKDAIWIAQAKIAPRAHGNTPQPPFDRAPYGQASSSDFKDDDIPF